MSNDWNRQHQAVSVAGPKASQAVSHTAFQFMQTTASLPSLCGPSAANPPRPPSSQSHSISPSAASEGFPGFALLASQKGATVGEVVRAQVSRPGGRLEPLLFPPAPSQEPVVKPLASSGDKHQ